MTTNDNSVNIDASKRPYHHGDLRSALVEEGLKLIQSRDADSLSLREIARNVGVSATAIYRHFPEKSALLSALAYEGLARLGQAQMDAMTKAGGGRAGFNASGRAYVRFAIAHPALFKLIMSSAPDTERAMVPGTHAPNPMRLLQDNVATLAPKGTDAAILRAVELRAWSQVHGLAMLILDGHIRADDALIDSVIDGDYIWPAKV